VARATLFSLNSRRITQSTFCFASHAVVKRTEEKIVCSVIVGAGGAIVCGRLWCRVVIVIVVIVLPININSIIVINIVIHHHPDHPRGHLSF
jgi:hypothetical protein